MDFQAGLVDVVARAGGRPDGTTVSEGHAEYQSKKQPAQKSEVSGDDARAGDAGDGRGFSGLGG